MAHTYHELHEMTVARLREIAADIDHEAVHGYSTMHKDSLVLAICTALGIESHEHHEVVGINKAKVKGQIRALKIERRAALEARDRAELHRVQRQIHRLKHRLRKATV